MGQLKLLWRFPCGSSNIPGLIPRMSNLFVTKPPDKLIAKSQEAGEHSLKRSLSPDDGGTAAVPFL